MQHPANSSSKEFAPYDLNTFDEATVFSSSEKKLTSFSTFARCQSLLPSHGLTLADAAVVTRNASIIYEIIDTQGNSMARRYAR